MKICKLCGNEVKRAGLKDYLYLFINPFTALMLPYVIMTRRFFIHKNCSRDYPPDDYLVPSACVVEIKKRR